MKLRQFNTILVICIIAVNGYVIVMPLLPAVNYTVAAHGSQPARLQTKIHVAPSQVAASPNTLTIPKMLLDQPVLEGRDTYAVLNQGILHWPASSTPDKGGNTVMLGHRFTYHVPKGVFYYLDKLAVGDEIGLTWNGTSYLYRVSQTKVVAPDDLSVEAPTSDARLTLFTCTPLWWPKERLVVIANLERQP